jgi:hypothetical protein
MWCGLSTQSFSVDDVVRGVNLNNYKLLSALAALCMLLAGCAAPRAPWGPLDRACTDSESCEGVPVDCWAGIFPKEANAVSKSLGGVIPLGRKGYDGQALLQSDGKTFSLWAPNLPQPQFPRALLVAQPRSGATAVLRFLTRSDGTVDRVCLHKLEGDPAFARNAAAALRQWRISAELLTLAKGQPFVYEVEFAFRIAD